MSNATECQIGDYGKCYKHDCNRTIRIAINTHGVPLNAKDVKIDRHYCEQCMSARYGGESTWNPPAHVKRLLEENKAMDNTITLTLPDPPEGYEYARGPDGRILVEEPNERAWMTVDGHVVTPERDYFTPMNERWWGVCRPILVKRPERKYMNFRRALEALRDGKKVMLDGFLWAKPGDCLGSNVLARDFDRTDFYVQE